MRLCVGGGRPSPPRRKPRSPNPAQKFPGKEPLSRNDPLFAGMIPGCRGERGGIWLSSCYAARETRTMAQNTGALVSTSSSSGGGSMLSSVYQFVCLPRRFLTTSLCLRQRATFGQSSIQQQRLEEPRKVCQERPLSQPRVGHRKSEHVARSWRASSNLDSHDQICNCW